MCDLEYSRAGPRYCGEIFDDACPGFLPPQDQLHGQSAAFASNLENRRTSSQNAVPESKTGGTTPAPK